MRSQRASFMKADMGLGAAAHFYEGPLQRVGGAQLRAQVLG